MKKIVSFIAVLLIGIFFNLNTEAYAATHYYKDQNTTAYTGSTSGHGSTYGYYNSQYNTVAVHKYSNNQPYIPFGTRIYLDSSLYLTGANTSRSNFMVTDTGSGPGKTPYWIDIYYGYNTSGAILFGNAKKVSYSATF